MSERTPGPWRIAENEWNAKPHEPWTDAIKIEGDVNANWAVPPLVAVTYRGEGNEANARLIAAAPDQHEALLAAPEPPENFCMLPPACMLDWGIAYRKWWTEQRGAALAKVVDA